jgi:hypothetical protein
MQRQQREGNSFSPCFILCPPRCSAQYLLTIYSIIALLMAVSLACMMSLDTDFEGELIISHIDGAQLLHFPSHKRVYFMAQSLLGVSLLLLLALGVVVSIYVIRFTIEDNIGVGRAQIVASLLNSGQIQVRI